MDPEREFLPDAELDSSVELGEDTLDAASDDDVSPSSEEPQVDWRARAERAEAERDAAAEREMGAQAAQHYANFQAGWDQAEQEIKKQVRQLDWEDAEARLDAFYKNRLNAERGYAANIIGFMQTQNSVETVLREYGLPAEDRDYLVGLPVEQMRRIAGRRAAERAEIDKRFAGIERKVNQTERKVARQQRVDSGADRVGGLRSGAPATSEPKPGSIADLARYFPELAGRRR